MFEIGKKRVSARVIKGSFYGFLSIEISFVHGALGQLDIWDDFLPSRQVTKRSVSRGAPCPRRVKWLIYYVQKRVTPIKINTCSSGDMFRIYTSWQIFSWSFDQKDAWRQFCDDDFWPRFQAIRKLVKCTAPAIYHWHHSESGVCSPVAPDMFWSQKTYNALLFFISSLILEFKKKQT